MKDKIIAKFYSLFIYPFQFKYFGKKSRIDKPLKLEGKRNIVIEKDVIINPCVWMASLPLCKNKNPLLKISSGCRIGHYCHIYSTNRVEIKSNVLIADKVYISDNSHSYYDINVPILNQPIRQLPEVVIGEGSWLGEHVCVLGASIGKHCIIGSNSVVTKDIPDYTVAAGVPAKIIKKYDYNTKTWLKY